MGDYDAFADAELAKLGEESEAELDDSRLANTGQIRFAHRLADRYENKLLSCYGRGWLVYDGKRWRDDDRHAATRFATSIVTAATSDAIRDPVLKADWARCTSARGIQGILDLAVADERLAATLDDLDSDGYLLNANNGTVDLRTGEFRQHDPMDRITKLTGADYMPGARSAAWEDFLASSLPDEEVRGFLQRYVGLALVGEVIEHKMVINIGRGRNGKGVFTNAVSSALGDYATTMSTEVFTLGRPEMSAGTSSEIMQLQGVRAVFMSEIPSGARLNEALMKNLTGGDKVKAKLMRRDPVEFTPSHSFVLSVNDLPSVAADADAVWARILAVPWTVSFLGREDAELPHRLATPEAHSAILAWAIQGLSDYQRVGLDPPEAVLARTSDYRKDMDAVAQFLSACCLLTPSVSARLKDLFDAYQDWSAEEGLAVLGRKHFTDAMGSHGYVAEGKWKLFHGVGLLTMQEDPNAA